MAEFVAGRGTQALGIIGTILGGLATVGMGNGLLGNCGAMTYEKSYATMHDVDDAKMIAQKDSEIAQLKAQQTVDAKIVDTYKTLANMISSLKEDENKKWTDQMVVNAQLTSAVNVNTNNLVALQRKVDGFTKVVIPSTSVCNTGCNCSGNM